MGLELRFGLGLRFRVKVKGFRVHMRVRVKIRVPVARLDRVGDRGLVRLVRRLGTLSRLRLRRLLDLLA